MPSQPSAAPRDLSGKDPLSVFLSGGAKDPLPSGDYIRIVAQYSGSDGKVVRNDFALHSRGARLCRLLDALQDAVDVDLRRKADPVNGPIPPVTLPQATRGGCDTIFRYLDLVQTRVPTLLSKPLRAPLEELVQPWEMKFLLEDCLAGVVPADGGFKGTTSLFKTLASKGPRTLDTLLEVCMLSDFLLIESLRDLTCAFLASLALSANNEKELLNLCGLQNALSDADLEPLYAQFGFLRPQDEM